MPYSDFGDDDNMSYMKTPNPEDAKNTKRYKKKKNSADMKNLLLLPFMLYAGSARFLLTFENKRSFVKFAQIQELVFHLIPLSSLIRYNNSTEINYSDPIDKTISIIFGLSFTFTIIEMVAFYCAKATKQNLEVNKKTGQANAS